MSRRTRWRAQGLEHQDDQCGADDRDARELALSGELPAQDDRQGVGGHNARKQAGAAIERDAERVLLGVEVDPRPEHVKGTVEEPDQDRRAGQRAGEEPGEAGPKLAADRPGGGQGNQGRQDGQGNGRDKSLLEEIAPIHVRVDVLGEARHDIEADHVTPEVGGDVQGRHQGHLVRPDARERQADRREAQQPWRAHENALTRRPVERSTNGAMISTPPRINRSASRIEMPAKV